MRWTGMNPEGRMGKGSLARGAMFVLGLGVWYGPASSSAQVRTPRAPGPRLPPAPAAIVLGAAQQHGGIYPRLNFDVPPGTVGIRVLRQTGTSQPLLLTPTSVPVAKLRAVTGTGYQWSDNTVPALGMYGYSVVAELDDGRQGPSAWFAFTPQLYEATNIRVAKVSNYNVTIAFYDGAVYASSFRLYGTGQPAMGTPAVLQQLMEQDPVTRIQYRVWKIELIGLAAGPYNWTLRGDFQPGIRTAGVPVSVVMP